MGAGSATVAGVLLNSAFEAGDRLLQHMVAPVSGDAPNGSTLPQAAQPFFRESETFLKKFFFTETTASRCWAASERRPSASGSFGGSSACGSRTVTYPPPSQKPDCRFRP